MHIQLAINSLPSRPLIYLSGDFWIISPAISPTAGFTLRSAMQAETNTTVMLVNPPSQPQVVTTVPAPIERNLVKKAYGRPEKSALLLIVEVVFRGVSLVSYMNYQLLLFSSYY